MHALAWMLGALLLPAGLLAQQQRHWVGGNGAWNDPANWAAQDGGLGGAGVPQDGDTVIISPEGGETVITMDRDARMGSLQVDGTNGGVVLQGKAKRVRIRGDVSLRGSVTWGLQGTVELVEGAPVAHLDLRGISLAGNLRVESGTWSMRSNLVLQETGLLELQGGTLATNGNLLSAGRLSVAQRKAKLMAGSSVVMLQRQPSVSPQDLDAGSSILLVAGVPAEWGGSATTYGNGRAQNVCATDVGQVPFTIDAQLLSSYNGYGVSCHGACDGEVRVVVSGGVGPFTYSWVGGPASATWTNVCQGNQIVIVTDQGQGVSCATNVQVTDPSLLSVIFSGVVPPACAGVCNGSATAFAVGGVPGYTYSWNNGAGTGPSFNTMCPGDNTLLVTDANGCTFDTTFSYPIQPIEVVLTLTDVQCANGCDGTASVVTTGGTGSLTYDWEPGTPDGDGTPQVTGLCAGHYTLTISDANGCDTLIQFEITEPAPIIPNLTTVDASCGGSCNGSASVSPTGGSGDYAYSWDPEPGAGQGTATATGLCEGSYTVTITDLATGCQVVATFSIGAPPALIPNPTGTNAGCSGECNGTASVAPSGGTTPYSYTWSPEPPAGQGEPTATGLCPGTWTVTIRDWANCDTTVEFLIEGAEPFNVVTSHTDETCGGYCDGTASVTVTGGQGPYTYEWGPDNPVGQGTSEVTGLCIGLWSVLITDQNGCDTLVQIQVDAPEPMVLDGIQTDETCSGDCDGTATVLVDGGTPPFTIVWTPEPPLGQGTPTAEGLCPGIWIAEVTDANNCSDFEPFEIMPADPMDVEVDLTDVSCHGDCDGEAVVIINSGITDPVFTWTPAPGGFQDPGHAIGLCTGDWEVTVTDAVTGCEITLPFTIAEPPAIEANAAVTDPTCAGTCDGSIVLSPSGGTGTYTFDWDPVPPNGNGTGQATGLCAGDYTVVISDADCDTTYHFTLQQPPAMDVDLTVTPASCADACDGTGELTGTLTGLTFTWSPEPAAGQGTPNATGFCAGPGSVTVVDAAGCDTVINFTITAPDPITVDAVVQDASCGSDCDGSITLDVDGGTPGYTFHWTPEPGAGQGTPAVGDLCPGDYTVTITDANGCELVRNFTISHPAGIDASGTATMPSCANACDGSVILVVTGGLDPYMFNWSPEPGTGQGTSSAGGLCAGTWTVLITDQAGCDTTLTFEIVDPDPIDPQGTFTNESCNGPCDGTATVSAVGGAGGYTYNWIPEPPAGQGTSSVSGLCAGDWCVTITDAEGCDVTWCFTVDPVSSIDATVAVNDGGCWGDCDGEATVTVSGGAGGHTYFWDPVPANGQGHDTATGLCEGDVSVFVTDAAGCDTTIHFTISNAPPIEANLSVIPENCTMPCSGAASVAPTGGSGTFVGYVWSPEPATGQGTSVVTGLCAGTNYSVTITDSEGCDTTVVFTVPEDQPIQATVNTTDATCWNTCDGTATVPGATGGTPPYTYFWDPAPANGQGTSQVTGLCPGSYTVTVGDVNGCTTLLDFTIAAPDPIDPQEVITPIQCGGGCSGAILLNPVGGHGGYSYVWIPEPGGGQGTAHAIQLCAGDWQVEITDAGGCVATAQFTLDEPDPLDVDVEVGQTHCGVCDGHLNVQVSGGLPPYVFQWGPPLNTVTNNGLMQGLCAGIYVVEVTDASGCSETRTMVVTDLDGEQLIMTDGSVTCPGDCDGTVSVSYNCSAPPCMTGWADLAGNPIATGTDQINGLCAGGYVAIVVNASGCITMDTAYVTEPPVMTADISSAPVSCAGECDGTATINVIGGVGPFEYTWSPAPGAGQGTPQATGLCAGVYEVFVHDLGGCDATFSVLIQDPDPITVDATAGDVSCAGSCDGSITLDAQGGTGGLSFLWGPQPGGGQGTASVIGLCAGDWTVTVVDGNGCEVVHTYTLTEPDPITATTSGTQSHCGVCDGEATVTASGGTGTLSIEWSDGGGVIGTGAVINNLCAGAYTATITDANGCSITLPVAIQDMDAEVLDVIDGQTLCGNQCDGEVSVSFTCSDAPCTVTWSDLAGNVLGNGNVLTDLCAGSYVVQVVNASGCVAIDTAHVVPSLVIEPNLVTTPATCNNTCDGAATVNPTGGMAPYTYAWSPEPGAGQGTSQATGLCEGTYVVLITDAGGCDTTMQVLITAPPPITVTADVQQVGCAGAADGSIVLTATGGTGMFSYTWDPVPPNGQGSNGALNIGAGDWTVIVTDFNGCTVTHTYTITEPDPITATISSTQSHCGVCDGGATVTASGGTGALSIEWSDGGGVIGTGAAISNLCAGTYTATITDANGCSTIVPVAIQDMDAEQLTTTDFTLGCTGDCDGVVEVSFTCSDAPCTIAWFDGAGNDLNESGTTLSNLCAGMYLVQITNGSGCVTIDTAYVHAPDPILANLTTVPESCPGACDGEATVGPTGGAGGYTYAWDINGTIHTGPSVAGLCAGTYSVVITDAAGCSITQDVLILSPDPITVDAAVGDITCAGSCDGTITLDAQGGTGGLSFLWVPQPGGGQGTASVTGLCAGDWTVTVVDGNGCGVMHTYTLIGPDPITATVSSTQSHCGVCDGGATVTASGGTGALSIEWSDGGGVIGTGAAISNLCAGTYTATTTDANGCSTTVPVAIQDMDAEQLTTTDFTLGCTGDCDGVVEVSFTCSDAPCTIAWFDGAGNDLNESGATLSNLCAGMYLVQVTNGSGCVTIDTAYVHAPDPILANLTTVPESCPGACDGEATVGPTGGAGGYTYAWDINGTIHTGPSVAGLCAGTYSVVITDADGCSITQDVLITAPPPITVSADVQQVNCAGAEDGSIVLTVTGGTGLFSYSWSPVPPNGQGSNGALNIGAGDWTVAVTDFNGCAVTETYTITEPDPLAMSVSTTLSACSLCDGTATVTASGGVPGYVITWLQNGAAIGTGGSIGNLCAGMYSVRVEDANGCSLELPVAIQDMDAEQLTTTNFMLGCAGDCNGVVEVSFTCSDAPCTIAWFDGAGNDLNESGATLSNLCAGMYLVQVTNGSGCVTIDTAYVHAPDPILANLTTVPESCPGACDGEATVGPTGGAGGYTYAWDINGTIHTGPSVTGLCAGTYSVVITDADGCSITQDVQILSPEVVTATAVVGQISCNAACDGSIHVAAQGGTGPYSFVWSPEPGNGQGTNTVWDLCAGTWTVTITDDHGCEVEYSVILNEPSPIIVDLSHTDNACYNDCVATAHVDISGGMGPYAIDWQDVDGNTVASDVEDLFGLCGGQYTVVVTDQHGCSTATDFTIDSGDPIDAGLAFIGESCLGPCDGTASVDPAGGSGPGYTIVWGPGNPAGQGTQQISGLCPGDYTVTITDAIGCDTTHAFTITPFQPITPVATIQDVTCNGDCDGSITLATTGGAGTLTYTWTPEPGSGQGTPAIGGLCPGDYTVTIADPAGCDTTLTYSIAEPPLLVVDVDTVIMASCTAANDGAISITISGGVPDYAISWIGPNAFSSSDEDLTGLSTGNYVLTVTDQNGCGYITIITVGTANALVADAGADLMECSGVEVILDGSNSQGASDFEWTDDAGTLLGNGPVVNLGVLPDGTYTFILTVTSGPCTETDTVEVTILPLPVADAGPDRFVYVEGTVVLGGNPAGPTGSQFFWQPDSLLDHHDIPNPTANVNQTTWFHLTVIAPNGCIGIDSVLVTVIPEVTVPSGFTPNGDGYNDDWVLDFVQLFPRMEVRVFSRWGEPLFHSVGYAVPWDGRYDGKPVPVGTYYYVIELNDERFPEPLTGPLTIIR